MRELVNFFTEYPLLSRTARDLNDLKTILDIEKKYRFVQPIHISKAAEASKNMMKKPPKAGSKVEQTYKKIEKMK